MKLGMNTVVFAGTDFETALQHVAWAGYEFVELAAIAGMAPHVEIGDDPQKIKDLLASNNLMATAMEAATTDVERLRGLFDLATQIGVPIVNIGSGGKTDDEDSTKSSIEFVRQVAQMAGDAGVTLAVKPHVGQAIYNAATGMRLMDEVTEGALGLNFDPSHLARADEDPAQVAPLWGQRIVTCHFRDCPVRVPGPPGTPEQQIPGRGALDLPGILKSLKNTGYNGPLNLEVIGAKDYPVSRAMGIAAEARGYLHRCLQEIA
ncbi:MAG TPA: sugar phosphate isomerase/epimerase [Abditibacteriaceae bacterium]|jgi:sugar phosphate isomerase/epimerase